MHKPSRSILKIKDQDVGNSAAVNLAELGMASGSVRIAFSNRRDAALSGRSATRPELRLPPPAPPGLFCPATTALTVRRLELRVEPRPLGIARAGAFVAVTRAASRRGHTLLLGLALT